MSGLKYYINCAWSLRSAKWAMAPKLNLPQYLASWGSNYTWICLTNSLQILSICEIMPWQELINHFTVLRSSSLWSCEIMYHALPTFLHLHHVWTIAILFSKCIALLFPNKKACQGVVTRNHTFTSPSQTVVSQATPFAQKKGLVMLQPSSCPHGRNLMWPIWSALFVDRICYIYKLSSPSDLVVRASD